MRLALGTLNTDAEIGIVIADVVECTLRKEATAPVLEQRPANNPDVVFYIRPETVYVLAHQTKDELSDISLNVFKEILAGNIVVKVPGNLLDLAQSSSLDILKRAGPPINSWAARLGLAPLVDAVVPKIVSTFKQLRR